MGNTVYCIASTEEQADTVLTELRNLGFSPADISVVLPNRATGTKNIGMKEDALRGAETGGLAGGILGWLAGIAALAIPGVGEFLIAGPLLTAVGGAVAGGVVGGLVGGTGAVHPLGLPKDVSSYIDERLRRGNIMISVHSDDSVSRERAVAVFKSVGANDIYYHDDQAAA